MIIYRQGNQKQAAALQLRRDKTPSRRKKGGRCDGYIF
nr:MAG TPA: 40S ribosomal protein S24 [Caudoviricetes sp.]DAZ37595.1 MAG TPA: 40S ribosomal protein S24 [Caudoviricetes sp.]